MIHSFNTEVAELCGINAATIFYNISYWVYYCETNNTNFVNGKYWAKNSNSAFAKQFPYLSEKQIRNSISKLEEKGLIVKSVLSEDPMDRTSWFSLTDKGYELSSWSNSEYAFAQNGKWSAQEGKSAIYIKYNNNENNEDSFEDNKLSSHSSSFVPPLSEEKGETPAESQKIFINFPLLGGKSVDITEAWCDEQQKLFGNSVNIRNEIKLAIAWCHANHYKQKWQAFLNNWFNTCLKKGGSAVPYVPEENSEEDKPYVAVNLRSKEEEEARVARAKALTSQVKARWQKQQEELLNEWNSRRNEE